MKNNKFKLIKEYPGSPELGAIAEFNGSKDSNYYTTARRLIFYKEDVETNPEFWAKYLFTTEDGVDIFGGERTYMVGKMGSKIHSEDPKRYRGDSTEHLYFSTSEAAQKYLDSLKDEFKFEKCAWYTHEGETFCFTREEAGKIYGYGFTYRGSWLEETDWDNREDELCPWQKATAKQVQELLLGEAVKRYPIGTRFYPAHLKNEDTRPLVLTSYKIVDFVSPSPNESLILTCASGAEWTPCVFCEGKWAEIVEMKYGVYTKSSWDTEEIEKIDCWNSLNPSWKWFDTKEERDEYIKMNKPMYSKKDMLDYALYHTGQIRQTDESFKLWEESK